jgi:inner membrane protein
VPVERGFSRPWLSWLPLVALAGVVLLDAAGTLGSWPIPLEGPRDWSAHLLTAAVVLAAFAPTASRRLWRWALAGAVVIDLDHVPLYLWGIGSATGNGRPVTHSLAMALVLALLALLATGAGKRRLRVPLCGLALGVVLHLVRDVATGPGVPLLWPLRDGSVLLPYAAYLVALAAGTLVATALGIRSAVSRR